MEIEPSPSSPPPVPDYPESPNSRPNTPESAWYPNNRTLSETRLAIRPQRDPRHIWAYINDCEDDDYLSIDNFDICAKLRDLKHLKWVMEQNKINIQLSRLDLSPADDASGQ